MGKNKWESMPDEIVVKKTVEAVKSRGINVILVENKEEALKKIIEIIPKSVSVASGSSITLNELGFIEYLKSGKHGLKNLPEEVLNEKDQRKQMDLRRKAVTADYFLGSVNAISQDGELVSCNASGSRVSAYPFAAKNLILVSGIQKIVPSLEEAMKRVREYVYPIENERAKKAYGMPSAIGKWVIIDREIIPNRTTLILVKEKLGF